MISENGLCFLELGHACVFLFHQRSFSFLKKSLELSKFCKQWLVSKVLDVFNMIISFVLALLFLFGVTRKNSLRTLVNKVSSEATLRIQRRRKSFNDTCNFRIALLLVMYAAAIPLSPFFFSRIYSPWLKTRPTPVHLTQRKLVEGI